MFETQKIDSFFSGEKNLLDEEEKIFISRRTKVVRFLKLFLPCLTALLLGLGIVLFDFENNNDTTIPLADEEKLYFEKFRMKNTVFEITEKDNQFSTIKAATVEETGPNTKIYNLANPYAESLDKNSVMTLIADKGVYHQQTQQLDLSKGVVANYNKDMKINTNSATYNFLSETGFGNEPIVGEGEKGAFKADKFTLDKKKGIIELIGHVYLKNEDIELNSPKKAVLYRNNNKFEAIEAVINKGKDILKGDILTAYFKNDKSFEIERAYSVGHTEISSEGKKAFSSRGEYDVATGLIKLFENVKIVDASGYTATGKEGIFDKNKKIFTLKGDVMITDKNGYKATAKTGIYDVNKKTFTLENDVKIAKGTNLITAPKAIYFQAKDEFRFYDNIVVKQENNTAKAKSGVYYIKKNYAELEHDVIITKNGNEVRGDKAISDFKTSKSRLVAAKGGRIYGKLIEDTLKDK